MQARNTYDRSAISSGYISNKSALGFGAPIQEDDDFDDDNDEAYHEEEDAQVSLVCASQKGWQCRCISLFSLL